MASTLTSTCTLRTTARKWEQLKVAKIPHWMASFPVVYLRMKKREEREATNGIERRKETKETKVLIGTVCVRCTTRPARDFSQDVSVSVAILLDEEEKGGQADKEEEKRLKKNKIK